MKKFGIIICLLTVLTTWCKASMYRIYQTEDGLSHNSVWAVMQDSRGHHVVRHQ